MFRLCLTGMAIHPDYLLGEPGLPYPPRLSVRQIQEWREYLSYRPFGPDVDQIGTAQICRSIFSAQGQSVSLENFLPFEIPVDQNEIAAALLEGVTPMPEAGAN